MAQQSKDLFFSPVCTCVLGTDEGHLVSVRFEADESTLPVHGLPGIRVEGVEPEGKAEHKC